MIYSISIVTNDSGCPVLGVDCSGLYKKRIDLFSSFLKAMEGLGSELFKGQNLNAVDFDDYAVKKFSMEEYDLVIIEDRSDDENNVILEKINGVLEEFKENIKLHTKNSRCFPSSHHLRVKLVDILSEFANESIERKSLISLRNIIDSMINQGRYHNLHTKIKLLDMRMKLGKLLDENVEKFAVLYDKSTKAMNEWMEMASDWLREAKNCIYRGYMNGKMNWTRVYMHLCNFSDALKRITRSEIAEKYLRMAKIIVDRKTSKEDLKRIGDKIVTMNDTINTYIRF